MVRCLLLPVIALCILAVEAAPQAKKSYCHAAPGYSPGYGLPVPVPEFPAPIPEPPVLEPPIPEAPVPEPEPPIPPTPAPTPTTTTTTTSPTASVCTPDGGPCDLSNPGACCGQICMSASPGPTCIS
ncbi:hypothetical protein FN846DRAFT_949696 [Sphaerosporella brunnea]|uniref:WAP domain-containing protein n=1 Tax=Sphaerosporella brunnea TaxID=1250544 RepID=A0A5J5EWC5_9PEZI|nr:hypothetical protein FN846DRAFT_949696 [Sphaerosporella brunnea]